MPDVSRREILRGATLAGAATVGGAAGLNTHAAFADGELFEANSLEAGSLGLEIATCTEAGGEEWYSPPLPDGESFPANFKQESDVTVRFPTIDPEQVPVSGSTTVAVRSCDNPGRIWLRTTSEQTTNDEPPTLAEAIDVVVSYAADCSADGSVVFEGSLAGFLEAFSDGVRLYEYCGELGKVEYKQDGKKFTVEETGDSLTVDQLPGTLTFEGTNGPVDVTLEERLYRKPSGEITGVSVESDQASFCRADVKGGGKQETSGNNTNTQGTGGSGGSGSGGGGSSADTSDGVKTYRLDCTSRVTGLTAGTNPSGNQSGLSYFELYTCGDDPCLTCDPNCLTIDWELTDAEGVAGEELSVELDLLLRQCRHTAPSNPWQ